MFVIAKKGRSLSGFIAKVDIISNFIIKKLSVYLRRGFVVTLNENHQIIILFHIIEIFHKFKKFKYYLIRKFTSNFHLRKKGHFKLGKTIGTFLTNYDVVNRKF